MISLSTLAAIEAQCQALKCSHSPLGGLKVVLATGDFHQFPPVTGTSLWEHAPLNSPDNHRGKVGSSMPCC